jgi:hypothetical protein
VPPIDRADAELVDPDGELRRTATAVPYDPSAMPNGGCGWLEVHCKRCETKASIPLEQCPPAVHHADLEARGGAEMQIVPDAAVLAAGAHD